MKISHFSGLVVLTVKTGFLIARSILTPPNSVVFNATQTDNISMTSVPKFI